MKILWHGPHPDMPTGYATQTQLLLPRLAKLGHEIAISATAGVESHPLMWRDFPVYPKTPYADVGEDVVRGHYAQFQADLCITFLCTWILKYPAVWRDMRVIHLTPVDCEPMSDMDYGVIADTGGMPAAISRFGERMMRKRGLAPLYLPHGVDTQVFAPPEDRAALRKSYGLDGKFVVGMNFMNNDRWRKNITRAIRGFAMFHAKHPDSVLCLHAIQQLPEGVKLPAFLRHLGIGKAVRWSEQYPLVTGLLPPEMMAAWYGGLDVLVNIGNEGFGLPAVEAQACGTPVILGDWTTGPDLVGDGWLVSGEREWNNAHEADWWFAYSKSVADRLEDAYEQTQDDAARYIGRSSAREFALRHDIDRVVSEHWEPVLSDLA